jgi:hypothetical protein
MHAYLTTGIQPGAELILQAVQASGYFQTCLKLKRILSYNLKGTERCDPPPPNHSLPPDQIYILQLQLKM